MYGFKTCILRRAYSTSCFECESLYTWHEDKSAFMRCNTCRYVVIFGRKDKYLVSKHHVSITYLYGGKWSLFDIYENMK